MIKLIPKKYLLFVLLAVLNLPIQAQVLINEFLASNITVNTDPLFSEYSDWLELYNASDQEFDLTGYSLSDDIENHGEWLFPDGTVIPANGYLLVWADSKNTGLHTNFNLSSNGEQVCLTDPEGLIVDSIILYFSDR